MTGYRLPNAYQVQYSRDGVNWIDSLTMRTPERAISEAREANKIDTEKAGDFIHRVITIPEGKEIYRRGWSRIEQENKQ